ncbi:hypothetical protein [Pelagicoccus sp. SDUM812003]|uniref:hypothetical protein n=1 Tax=Pelagicoccus sp. SDUM812003 TaxID=3041267 RepID=UPI00280EFEDA|nr:hypothetical protein [Pelagicoccus sp. SDUM812003]MDQ8203541.1 hypothetical protein [Pelagicoccus sp. SDUM812003]
MTKPLLPLLAATLLFGCSNQEEEEAKTQAIADAAAQKAVAESDAKHEQDMAAMKAESEGKLANLKSEMEDKLADEKAKMQEEMKAELAAQAEELKAQYAASNRAIETQLESLTSKYESLKDKLPESAVTTFENKLPELQSSLGSLQSIVSNFNPSSLEQLKDLQTKYQKELAVAKQVADELLKLLGKSSLSELMPKL